MKTLFRILGTAAAVAVTGAAIVALDKILNQKDPLHVERRVPGGRRAER